MKTSITIPQLETIHRILREAEDAILDGTGHHLILFIRETEMLFGVSAIISIISGALNVPVYAILSESRRAEAKEARQICAYLINRFLPSVPTSEIAKALQRDRSTIHHTLNYVNDRISTNDERFINKLNAAEAAIKKMIDENKVNT